MDTSLQSERFESFCDMSHVADTGDNNCEKKPQPPPPVLPHLLPQMLHNGDTQHQQPTPLADSTDTADNDLNVFCCENCYQCLSYYIDENIRLTYEQIEMRKSFKRMKRRYAIMRPKLSLLEFELFESRAQKEDLEERLNLLMKSLVKAQQKTPATAAATTAAVPSRPRTIDNFCTPTSTAPTSNKELETVFQDVMDELLTRVESQLSLPSDHDVQPSQSVEDMEKQWLNERTRMTQECEKVRDELSEAHRKLQASVLERQTLEAELVEITRLGEERAARQEERRRQLELQLDAAQAQLTAAANSVISSAAAASQANDLLCFESLPETTASVVVDSNGDLTLVTAQLAELKTKYGIEGDQLVHSYEKMRDTGEQRVQAAMVAHKADSEEQVERARSHVRLLQQQHEQHLMEHIGEMEALSVKLVATESQLAAALDANETMLNEHRALTESMTSERTREQSELGEQVAALNGRLAEAERSLTASVEAKAVLVAEMAEHKRQSELSLARLGTLLAEAQEQLDAHTRHHEAEMATLQAKLTESERFLLSARGDKDALGQELSELRLRSEMSAAHYDEQLTQLNYKLQQQQQAIKSVQIECEVNSRVDEATGETTEESSRGLEIVVDEMVAHVETCHTLDAENQRLLNRLADAQSERTLLQQSCERLRAEMLEARHELSASLAEKQVLTTELHELQQRGKQHDQVAAVLATQLADSQAKLTAALSDMQAQAAAHSSRLAEAEASRAHEASQMSAQLAEIRAHLAAAQDLEASTASRLAQLEQQSEHMRRDLQLQLDQARDSLANAEKRHVEHVSALDKQLNDARLAAALAHEEKQALRNENVALKSTVATSEACQRDYQQRTRIEIKALNEKAKHQCDRFERILAERKQKNEELRKNCANEVAQSVVREALTRVELQLATEASGELRRTHARTHQELTAKCAAACAELDEARRQFARVLTDKDTLSGELDALKRHNEQSGCRLAEYQRRMESQLSAIQSQLDEQQRSRHRESEQLNNKIAEAKSKLANALAETANLKTRYDERKVQFDNELSVANAHIKQQHMLHADEMDKERAKLAELKQKYASDKEHWTSVYEAKVAELCEAQSRLAETLTSMNERSAELNGMLLASEQSRRVHEEFQRRLDAHVADQARLEEQQRADRDEIAKLRAKLAARNAAGAAPHIDEAVIERLTQTKIDLVMKKRAEADEKLKAEVEALAGQLAIKENEIKAQARDSDKRIKRMKDELEDMQRTNDFLQETIDDLNAKLWELSSNVKENKAASPSQQTTSEKRQPNLLLPAAADCSPLAPYNRNQNHNQTRDINNATAQQQQQQQPKTPLNMRTVANQAQATPASVRRANQCAQQ